MKNRIIQDVSFSAGRTIHFYNMSTDNYENFLYGNNTKTYKKSTNRLEHARNMKAKHVAKNFKVDNRIENLAKTPAFITLKDRKEI